MKKFLSFILTVAIIVISAPQIRADVSCKQVNYPIYFNGNPAPVDEQPTLSLNNRTYVPLRKVCEGSGLLVNWVSETKEIYVYNNAYYASRDHMLLSQIYNLFALSNSNTARMMDTLIAYIDDSSKLSDYELEYDILETYISTIETISSQLTGYTSDVVTQDFYTDVDDIYYALLDVSTSFYIAGETITGYHKGYYTYSYATETLSMAFSKIKESSTETFKVSSLMNSVLIPLKILADKTLPGGYTYFDYQAIKSF